MYTYNYYHALFRARPKPPAQASGSVSVPAAAWLFLACPPLRIRATTWRLRSGTRAWGSLASPASQAPTEPARTPYVTEQLGSTEGPIVAVTDFMKAVPDQVARFVPQPFVSLGTDGYGFSDTREALRRHFEVDAAHIVVATLSSLARQGDVKDEAVAEAIQRYGIDAEAIDPRLA